MKLAKLLLAGMGVLALSSAAHAQTVIRLTGSSAFRGATHNAIRNIMAAGHTYAYTGTTLSGAGQAIFSGTVAGNPVIIKTAWSGSVGGAQTVSQSIAIPFLPDVTTQSTGGTSGATTATSGNGGDVSIPDVGMSDTYQNATPFASPVLVDILVGVQPFKWLVNRGLTQVAISVDTTASSNSVAIASTAGLSAGMTVTGTNIPAGSKIGQITSGTTFTLVKITDGTANNASTTASGNAAIAVAQAPISNMTPQLAQALFANGKLPLALWTGLPADETTFVWATGRDPDSGTRLTAFAEAGVGVNSTVVQYQPTISGITVSSHVPWPQTTVNGIVFTTGNGGYSSGGNLVTALSATTSAINGYYVSYLSTGDATTALNAGAKELSYNGTFYSLQGVQEGSYPFWCYEHLTYRSSLAGVAKTVADTLANQITTVDSPILLSSMKVGRASDGGLITPNY